MEQEYVFSESEFRAALAENGYASIKQFAQRTGLNRNTVHNYLRGRGVFRSEFMRIVSALHRDPLECIVARHDSRFKPEHRIVEIARAVCSVHRESCGILFGSRLTPSHHPFADWDLGVATARGYLSAGKFSRMKDIVEDTSEDYPCKIDLVNLDTAPEWFIREMNPTPSLCVGSDLAYRRFIRRWERVHGRERETAAVA
jgi:hypothetical protein